MEQEMRNHPSDNPSMNPPVEDPVDKLQDGVNFDHGRLAQRQSEASFDLQAEQAKSAASAGDMPVLHTEPTIKEDWLEVVRYFAKEEKGKEEAQKIARQGQDWANSALRNDDMEVWFFRLLLE